MKWIDVPPMWLLGFAVIAHVQAQHFSFGLSLAHPVTMLVGGVLVGAGIVLILLAAMEFRRHKTTIVPHQEATTLIQTGVFKRSRNPIYLADVLILTGLVLRWDAVLSLVLVPVLFWVLETRFVIPEENRLRRHFRADFARYAQKTRRWM
ncbi:MAG: isoprenylcysteine carboxylmethyltransferase family protein [Roseobacter sp.]|nr:isoprenylcysteine carboxylmethyltransferase family protein [Roseobacter sp.]